MTVDIIAYSLATSGRHRRDLNQYSWAEASQASASLAVIQALRKLIKSAWPLLTANAALVAMSGVDKGVSTLSGWSKAIKVGRGLDSI